jgi:hypothetical protein
MNASLRLSICYEKSLPYQCVYELFDYVFEGVNSLASITELSRGLGKTLLIWSVSSIIIGIMLYIFSVPLVQGIGLQAIFWGIIDALIALFTLFKQSNKKIGELIKILRINVGLDIVYQIVGVLLLVLMWQDMFIAGNGIGVIIQGAFLLFLDLYYLLKMKRVALEQEVD